MARLDTGWHANPKILALELPAMALHAWSISYCDYVRSDGFIPSGAWPSKAGAGAAVKALLGAGLWEPADGGFRLHDYLDWNHSRAEIEAYMAAKTAAGQAGGQASAQARARRHAQAPAQAPAQARAQPNGQADAQAKLKHDLKQNPTPYPGTLVNSRPPAWQAGRTARTRARGEADLHPLGTLLASNSADYPEEVRQRLERSPIGQPALPAEPQKIFEKKDADHALG